MMAACGGIAMTPAQRALHLDLLRAVAIGSVVVYHLTQQLSVPMPGITRFTSYGQYGVDLFFLLSGYLIGSLYWSEYQQRGAVDVPRFWLRRWM
jgi:peptidoglycan/LPS O-acetylase OafA/YrhL